MIQLSRRQMVLGGAASLALAGCSSGGGSTGGQDLSANKVGAMSAFNVGEQFKAAAPLSFSVLYNNSPNYPLKNDWLFWSELTKRTGVTLQPVAVDASDYNQKRSLMIGANTAPTIIPKTYPGQEIPFVASGAILPVSDYLDLMPNFKDKVAKWNLEGDINTLRQADGKFYLLPGLHQDVWVDYTLAVRTDVLTQLGIPTPATWDDVHAMLKTMKAAYPDSYPLSDRFGIPTPGGNLLNILGAAYGTAGGWGYANATWDAGAGNYVFTGAMDQYKQMIQYLNTLVNEKLLDPESFTQSDDAAIQKLATGKSFVISTNAQNIVNDYRPALAKTFPNATIAKIPVPIGLSGDSKAGSRLENGVMILKAARGSKNFVAMMQFIDWLWYSDAGQVFAKWGIEGVTYTQDASGKFQLTPDVNFVGLNPKGSKHLQKDFGFSNGVFAYGGSTALLESTFSPEELAFQAVMNARKTLPVPPPYPLTETERTESSLWDTPLTDYVQQATLQFILGQRSLSSWDGYISDLKGKGSQNYINLVNTAYQRFKKANG
jgi:putative aldouronate transport system substrate-binding protein